MNHLVTERLGNRRTRNDVLQVLSFPGLSVDNVASVPANATDPGGQISGQPSSSAAGAVGGQVASLNKQLTDLKTVQQNQLDKINENTQALVKNTTSRSGSGAGATSGSSLVSTLLGSAFGLSPIFSGLFSLFGGSSATPILPPTPFTLPASIQYAGGVTQTGGILPVDYGQNGQARTLGGQTQGGTSGGSQGASVHINVNAMDSQSFLDHSDDIARAVRQALLQSNSLSDVIGGM